MGRWGDGGTGGQGDKGTRRNYQCPIPNPQCPIPNAQSPIPNAQLPSSGHVVGHEIVSHLGVGENCSTLVK